MFSSCFLFCLLKNIFPSGLFPLILTVESFKHCKVFAITYLLWLLFRINVEKIIAVKDYQACQDLNSDLSDTGAEL